VRWTVQNKTSKVNIRKKERKKEGKKWVTRGLWVTYLQHTIEEGRKVMKALMSIY